MATTIQQDSQKSIRNLMPLDFKGKMFLDLGACVGLVSHWAQDMGAEAFAVEAHPDNFRQILSVPKLNAVVNASGDPAHLSISSRATNHCAFLVQKPKNSMLVEGAKFDDLLDDLKPQIIKMDIEKAEYDCLLNGCNEGQLNGVESIGVEFHAMNDAQGLCFYLAIKKLEALGFNNYRPWGDGYRIHERGGLNIIHKDFLFSRHAPKRSIPDVIRDNAHNIYRHNFVNCKGIYKDPRYISAVHMNEQFI